MKTHPDYEKDLATIRNMMERSAKFLSLSGLSGILAGVYALAGAAIAYLIVQYPASPFQYRQQTVRDPETLTKLVALAAAVLTASLLTAWWHSRRKARRQGERLWNRSSRMILINFLIPLVTGGIFILIMLYTGHFGLAAPACLIFYGLALIRVSPNTFDEVRNLGFCQIGLGLLAAAMPGHGLVYWAVGFGLLHIIYGAVMYNKYDR